ncbi:DNA-directed primase/polymerase protein-like [Argopecten irradians]|uniref:DNA-directed primase/polymerase protein-like n=1 Tax=Argopecten irradians TaxID=31199 RepID=UPI0037130B37
MAALHPNGSGIARFYGGKQKRQWCKLEAAVNEQVKKHRSEKIPELFKPTILGPTAKWETFFRQQDAFLFARSHASDLHVFAFESESLGSDSGQRQYLVTSYLVFWHYYNQLKDSCRHHYEVIPQNAVCKLYFDLEFLKEHNADKDGDHMVEVFIKYVCYWLNEKFGISCDRKSVLDLDASTKVKFSRHLIYLLPGVAFRDNIQAGNFVHFVANEVRKQGGEPLKESDTKQQSECGQDTNQQLEDGQDTRKLPEGITVGDLESLMVKNKDGKDVLFCDLGVYTKNRNFRLYLSCKLGKDNPLLLSSSNMYHTTLSQQRSEDTNKSPGSGSPDLHLSSNKGSDRDELIFMDSLVANVQYQANTRILTFDSGRIQCHSSLGHRKDGKQDTTETLGGRHHSPYPEVDNYITSRIQRDGVQGHIRHWTYFSEGEIIVYEIGKNRWCENIGRPHKSNNIMMIADLKMSVYYQKCHDPDCKRQNFKSPDYPLPNDVLLSSFFDETEEDFLGEMDDEACLQAAMEMESSFKEDTSLTRQAALKVSNSNDQSDDRTNGVQSGNVTRTPTVNVTCTPTVNVTCTPTVNVTRTPTVNVTHTPTVNVTRTPTVNVTRTTTVNVTRTPTVNVTHTPTVNVTRTTTVNVTRTPTEQDKESSKDEVSAITSMSCGEVDCWDSDDDLLTAVTVDDSQK